MLKTKKNRKKGEKDMKREVESLIEELTGASCWVAMEASIVPSEFHLSFSLSLT